MKDYHLLKDDESKLYNRKGTKNRPMCVYSDTIYTFDIEVSNLFFIDGKWQVFDKQYDKAFYTDIEKIGIPYIWQFSINDQVYFGRELWDFLDVLKTISNEYIRKIIYIHNLSYEFQFLLNLLDGYTITDMICRDIHKPISFVVDELNIEFRCSYMLTNLSLAKAAEEFTNVKKLDSLKYDACIRTPLTYLSQEELLYCEYDCICLYNVIKYFYDRYDHIANIPYTSTGEVRRAFRSEVDHWYIHKMQKLVPQRKTYMILWACFSGGYTHSNIINTGRVIKGAKGKDIASSYPYSMLCKLPATQFMRCLKSEFMTNENFGYIAYIKMYGVKSRYYTHYMQVSKCINSRHVIADNGRVVKCDYTEMWITSIDFEIIQKNYSMHHYEIVKCYKARLDYLDERIIKFILRLYGNKTKLKGIPEKESIYKRDKAMLNSLYGMSVTNPLKQSASYNGGWCRSELTEDFIDEKLSEMKHSGSTLMYYGMGVWITALSRKHLLDCVLYSHEFDKNVIYCDTDSIKYIGNFEYIFEEYNQKVYQSYLELIKKYPDLKIQDFCPVDINGISHPIGMYENDGEYTDGFITLGAKKYCYYEDGKLKLTISGVSKKGVSAFDNDIKKFKKGFVFDYDHSGKLTHFYNDEQPETDIIDDAGNVYHSTYRYGITLAPTTYTMGVTDLYEMLVMDYFIKDAERRKRENGE